MPLIFKLALPLRAPEILSVEPEATVTAMFAPREMPPDWVAVPEPKDVLKVRVPPAALPATMLRER